MPNFIEYNVRVYSNGNKYWYQNGEFHRVGGPAVERANGDKHWYLNGKLHRVGGPAIETADGVKHWYQNGKLHRVDGPAIETADGDKYWYENGEFVTRPHPPVCDKVIEIDGIKYKLTKV